MNLSTSYNPMEMPFVPTTASRTTASKCECDGQLGCDCTATTDGSSTAEIIDASGSALTGLASVLGVFFGGTNTGTTTNTGTGTTTNTGTGTIPPKKDNTLLYVVIGIVLLILIVVGVVMAIKSSKK